MMGRRISSLLMSLASFGCSSEGDRLKLAAVFSSHMVLQREIPIPVWGWAKPGSGVTVKLNDKKVTTTAGADGTWSAALEAFHAGGPFTLTVSGRGEVVCEDVLVGDVYLCCGQSNMEWPVESSLNSEDEMAAAKFPQIRHLTIPKATTAKPQADLETARWRVCSPAAVGSWGAVGFYFARTLEQALNIPIGIINASYGGTTCEAWMSLESIEPFRESRESLRLLSIGAGDQPSTWREYEDRVAKWEKSRESFDAGSRPGEPGWSEPSLDASHWKSMDLPQYWEKAGLPDLDGVVWFRRTVTIPPELARRTLTISLGPIDDDDVTWWNGVRIGATEGWDVPRVYSVPESAVKEGPNVIAVRVLDKGGGGGFHGTPEQMKVVEGPISLAGPWSYKIGVDFSTVPKPDPPPFMGNPKTPTGHYNAMIAPLVRFGMRGVVWYLGEDDVAHPARYADQLTAVIKDWRARWQLGDIPFYFVQLPAYRPAREQPGESEWAEFREAQARVLTLPNTGMAVTIDVGDASTRTPINKQVVGKRLAQWALGTAYRWNVVRSGPLYRSMAVEGSKIRLSFEHVGGGLIAKGGPLKQFAIAGEDRAWAWAEAVVDRESILVWSSQVPKPVAVRYAWADNPEGANLYNREGLPAGPFRTGP